MSTLGEEKVDVQSWLEQERDTEKAEEDSKLGGKSQECNHK